MKFSICQGVLCYRCLLDAFEMNLTLHSGALSSSRVRHKFPAYRTLLVSAKIKEPEAVLRRRLALRKVDRELSRGNYKTALTLVKQLQGKPGGLRGFGAAKQVFNPPSLKFPSCCLAAQKNVGKENKVTSFVLVRGVFSHQNSNFLGWGTRIEHWRISGDLVEKKIKL